MNRGGFTDLNHKTQCKGTGNEQTDVNSHVASSYRKSLS